MKRLAGLLAVAMLAVMTHAQWNNQPAPVPAYNPKPPAKGEKLPPILTPNQLAQMGYTAPAQVEAYRAAAKIPAVLHQMPCYCYCDRAHGHNSLHSCFESEHGANCGICMAESLYAYKMSKKGWSAKMIRDGIIRGDFKKMDLQHPEHVM